jgi:hypothetical protein
MRATGISNMVHDSVFVITYQDETDRGGYGELPIRTIRIGDDMTEGKVKAITVQYADEHPYPVVTFHFGDYATVMPGAKVLSYSMKVSAENQRPSVSSGYRATDH